MFRSIKPKIPASNIHVTVHKECFGKTKVDLVGAIDQGTSSTRFLVFTKQGQVAAWAQMEHEQIFPSGAEKVRCRDGMCMSVLSLSHQLAGWMA